MTAHPWHSGCVIELMVDGSVHVVRESDGRIVKSFKSKYSFIGWHPEMLGLCDKEAGEFILLVCDGNGKEKQPWRVFSSATDTWTEMDWPSTDGRTSTLFIDVTINYLCFRINE